MNTWKPILAALVIFAAGVVTGGLTIKLRQPRLAHPASAQIKRQAALPREGQLRELSRRMQNQLDLTPDQRERIESIIRNSQEKMKSLRDQVGQRITEESREMRQRIRDVLTVEQRHSFAEIMKQHDERSKHEDRNPRSTSPSGDKPE